eukprot:351111-Chlamydomonas_euryale.AAC.1
MGKVAADSRWSQSVPRGVAAWRCVGVWGLGCWRVKGLERSGRAGRAERAGGGRKGRKGGKGQEGAGRAGRGNNPSVPAEPVDPGWPRCGVA